MMIKDVEVERVGNESGATGSFLAELRRGPFAPALCSSILDHYGVTMKLAEFILPSRYLARMPVASVPSIGIAAISVASRNSSGA